MGDNNGRSGLISRRMTTPDTSKTQEERYEPLELAIYSRSPLGYWGTTIALFVFSMGSYALIATLTQRPPLIEFNEDGSWHADNVVYIAFVLSAIFTAAPAISENGRRYWERFAVEMAATVPEAAKPLALQFGDGRLSVKKRPIYRWLLVFGLIGALIQNAIIMVFMGATPLFYLGTVGLWFLLTSPLLYGMGLRAGYDVSREGGELKRFIREHVEIDLFHLDRLDIYGRIGLRAALSWMIMAAVLLLFVVDPRQIWAGLVGLGFAGAGALTIFTSAVRPVHDKIRAAKEAELQRIHEAMAEQRERALSGDSEAAGALAGLTDYEIWIQQRPEWPISPTVTLRFSLYVLIPVVPIIGSYLFENIADFVLLGG